MGLEHLHRLPVPLSLYPSENDATSVLQPPNLFYSLVGRDGKQLGDPGELNYGELGRLVRAEDVLAVEFRLLLQYLVLSSVSGSPRRRACQQWRKCPWMVLSTRLSNRP